MFSIKWILNSLSSLSISTVRLLAATMSLYSGSASTGPDTEESEKNRDEPHCTTQDPGGVDGSRSNYSHLTYT